MFDRLNSILNWSVRVGKLFGIPISLHISLIFFLLPALSGRGFSLWYGVEWAVLVVLSILLHELGHALTAKRYRLTDLSIMLHGFGGFAVSSGHRTPTMSLVIALAGPAVTFALGLLCLAIGYYGGNAIESSMAVEIQFGIVHQLGRLNILLGFLNLIPSHPFDGGHALSAILSRKMNPFKADRAVAHLGLIITVPLALYGYFTRQGFLAIFGIIGFISSLSLLLQTGGVKFGEVMDDRRHRKELEAVKKRQEERTQAYLSDVKSREKEREERERLRKILEASIEED